jgi:hypothetical protein
MSTVQARVGDLAAKALSATGDPDPARLTQLLPRAVRFYLAERGREAPEWRYAPFLPLRDGLKGGREVALEEALWEELVAEAKRQDVAPTDLLQHAAFYYAAARDQGRLTERIAKELGMEEGRS